MDIDYPLTRKKYLFIGGGLENTRNVTTISYFPFQSFKQSKIIGEFPIS